MRAHRAHGRDDRGSVLLLGLGLLGVCLLALVVVVDAASAFAQRRQLYSLADTAALGAAQSLDLAAYYAHGASARTRLEAAAVRERAVHSLHSVQALAPVPGLRIDAVQTDGVTVRVDLSAPLRLPFLSGLGPREVQVSSAARLDYRAGEG